MIAGKFTCPNCKSHFELSTTAAPAQQSQAKEYVKGGNINAKVQGLLDQIYDGVMMGTPLDDTSEEFVSKTKARLEMCEEKDWEIRMTDKQMSYLASLAAKAGVD